MYNYDAVKPWQFNLRSYKTADDFHVSFDRFKFTTYSPGEKSCNAIAFLQFLLIDIFWFFNFGVQFISTLSVWSGKKNLNSANSPEHFNIWQPYTHCTSFCLKTRSKEKTTFSTLTLISKPKDTFKNKRIAKKKKQVTYTSLGKGQTMMALHNLGKSSNKIASTLGCNALTVWRVLDAYKKTGTFE